MLAAEAALVVDFQALLVLVVGPLAVALRGLAGPAEEHLADCDCSPVSVGVA